jgi:hypothetical protein
MIAFQTVGRKVFAFRPADPTNGVYGYHPEIAVLPEAPIRIMSTN